MKNPLLKGMRETLPVHIQKKVYPTNLILACLLFGLAIPFTVISMIYFDWLFVFPAFGGVFTIIAYLFNCYHKNGIHVSRIIACTVPMILAACYNAYLSGDDGQPLPALYLCEGSFLSIPFVLYDLKERKQLFSMTLICLTILLSFPVQNDLLVCSIDSQVMRTGWLSWLTVMLACLTDMGLILGLAVMNKKEIEISNTLSRENERQNYILQNSNKEKALALQKLSEEKDRENWVRNGIAAIAKVFRQSDAYDKLISSICSYTKASAGVVFKCDIDYLYPQSYYGIKSDYNLVENSGLTRESYRSKQIKITKASGIIESGLGKCESCMLISPAITIDGETVGIIELHYHKEPSEETISYVEQASELLSNYIIRTHERTTIS